MFKLWHKEVKCWIGCNPCIFQDGQIGRWSSNVPFDFFKSENIEIVWNTGINDVNGDLIYGGDIVHQVAVLVGSLDIDFTGEVKFYDGSWWIDNGEDSVLLFNETCENEIIGNKFQGCNK